jgi:hypothetical protein
MSHVQVQVQRSSSSSSSSRAITSDEAQLFFVQVQTALTATNGLTPSNVKRRADQLVRLMSDLTTTSARRAELERQENIIKEKIAIMQRFVAADRYVFLWVVCVVLCCFEFVGFM